MGVVFGKPLLYMSAFLKNLKMNTLKICFKLVQTESGEKWIEFCLRPREQFAKLKIRFDDATN